MIETLFSLDLLNSPLGLAVALLVGLAFGICLEQAGFGSSKRLSGVFRFTDMSVVKVMFSALAVACLLLHLAQVSGLVASDALYHLPTVLGPAIIGGVLLGIGFCIGGWCPGTAIVGLASAKLDALIFLVGTGIGVVIYDLVFPKLEGLLRLGDMGVSTLPQVLGAPPAFVVVGICLLAAAAFVFSEWVENRYAGPSAPKPRYVSALACGMVLVAVAGMGLQLKEPFFSAGVTAGVGKKASPQLERETATLTAVRQGLDHLDVWELAAAIMRGDSDLTVVDVREPSEYATFHLRSSVNIPLPELPKELASLKNVGRVVLYSNGAVHPAQAREALTRLGFTNVLILAGGLNDFFDEVLTPVSLRQKAPAPELAERIRAARAFFGEPGRIPQPTEQAQATPVDKDKANAAPAEFNLPSAPPLLVNADWLAANLGKPGLAVLDVRSQPEYNGGHIPGALSLQPDNLRSNLAGLPSMLSPPQILAQIFGQMGLSPEQLLVIVYGDRPIDATLVAMACERLGHSRYAILQGGMKGYAAKQLPTDTLLPKVSMRPYNHKGHDNFTVDAGFVLSRLGQSPILDVRPKDYFTGEKRDEARGGHIPGALNRPFSDDTAKSADGTVQLRTIEELGAAYAALFPNKNTEIVVHCRTGHQASQTWWVLSRLLGYTNVKYYDAGWTEWAARPELPVVEGP